jgi:hypothetical protein
MPTTEIDRYVTYFRRVLEAIEKLQANADPPVEPFFQKILYCCCLDSWSGDAFPGMRNKERFIKFVNDVSEWDLRDRVSAFQLQLALEEEGLRNSPLWDHITAHLWRSGKVTSTSADCDPTFAELIKHARTDNECGILRENRYDHLLYHYRNSVIHEFLIPGKGFEFKQEEKPYYINLASKTDSDDENSVADETCSKELVFPNLFLHSFCERSLEAFERWLSVNARNPYDSMPLTSRWKFRRQTSPVEAFSTPARHLI